MTGRTYRSAALGLLIALGVAAAPQVQAAPVFYVSPGNNPNGDVNWQNAAIGAGASLAEQDFESFTNGSDIGPFSIGGVQVSISYGSNAGTTGEIFSGSFGSNANMVAGKSLLNRNASNVGDPVMILNFDAPVIGFGTWVFDNNSGSAESFVLSALMQDSPVLDANPGSTAHQVDGFFGVVDAAGISQVKISMTSSASAVFFELDHMQIATGPLSTVPAPAPLALLGLALCALGLRRRRV